MVDSIKSPGFALAAVDAVGVMGVAAYTIQKLTVIETEMSELSKRLAGVILRGEAGKPQKDKQAELEEIVAQLTTAANQQKKLLLRELEQKDEELREIHSAVSEIISKLQAGSSGSEFKSVTLKPLEDKRSRQRHQRRSRRRQYDDDEDDDSSNEDVSAVRRNR